MTDVLTEPGVPPKRELTLTQKLRYPEATHVSRHEISKTMQQAAGRIEWLESRLEIGPSHSYDGIDCRDETIRQLDKEVARLAAERDQESRLREAAFLDCNDMKHDIERLTSANAELATENEAMLAAADSLSPPRRRKHAVDMRLKRRISFSCPVCAASMTIEKEVVIHDKCISVGDIVQVNPEKEMFGGCMVVVTEVKSWGVQGYVQSAAVAGQQYVRLKHEEFERTGGKAAWVVA